MAAYLEFAGACNPTDAGHGFVLVNDDSNDVMYEGSDFLGSNFSIQQAEYKGLISGLLRARAMDITEITIYGDSPAVVKQVLGECRVRSAKLKRYYNEVIDLLEDFEYSIERMTREDNEDAVSLAEEGLDKDYEDYTYAQKRIESQCWNADNAWKYLLNQRIRGFWRMKFMLGVIQNRYPGVYNDVVHWIMQTVAIHQQQSLLLIDYSF